jgi:ABC-type uncharacterized transport system auxiliary subunit
MTPVRLLAAGGCLVALAGCGSLFQSHQLLPTVYRLNAVPVAAAPAVVGATLMIARPVARPGLEGDRIAVTLPDHRLDNYATGRWPGPLPRIVEALLVDGFRSAGGWQAVVTDRSGFAARYVLQTEVQEFAADYAAVGAAPVARVTLRGELGIAAERRLVASAAASAAVPAAADRAHDVAAAFEAAYAEAAAKLIAAIDAAALAAEQARPAPAAH